MSTNESLARFQFVQAPEGVTVGVILVSSSAHVISMNGAARRLIDAGTGLSVGSGGIRASRPRETCLLHALIDAASQRTMLSGLHSGGALRIPRFDERSALEVLVAPFHANGAARREARVAAVIYVIDPTVGSSSCGAQFARAHALTPAEARVASLIASGHTGRQAAEHLGISYNTLKTHLKQVFAKTGARRQVGLIRLMMSFEGTAR